MTQNLYPPARPQTVREVLDTGWHIFKATVGSTLSYAMLMSLAIEFPNLYTIALGRPLPSQEETDPQWWAWGIVGLILSLLLWGALLLRQKALVSGERTSTMAELKLAAVQLSRVIAATGLWMIGVGVALGPYIAGTQLAGLNGVQSAADALKALALSPLTLPAVWLSVALMFAPMLVVLRKLGPLDALVASLRLVRGHWWRASMVTGVGYAAVFVLVVCVAAVAGALVGLAGVVDQSGAADLWVISLAAVPVGIVCSALSFTVMSAMMLALLGDLSVRLTARTAGPQS